MPQPVARAATADLRPRDVPRVVPDPGFGHLMRTLAVLTLAVGFLILAAIF